MHERFDKSDYMSEQAKTGEKRKQLVASIANIEGVVAKLQHLANQLKVAYL